jgi:hypothetical protein
MNQNEPMSQMAHQILPDHEKCVLRRSGQVTRIGAVSFWRNPGLVVTRRKPE